MERKVGSDEAQTCRSDQLDIAIDSCIPPLASKLRDMSIKDFKELYHFGVQVEANLTESIYE